MWSNNDEVASRRTIINMKPQKTLYMNFSNGEYEYIKKELDDSIEIYARKYE